MSATHPLPCRNTYGGILDFRKLEPITRLEVFKKNMVFDDMSLSDTPFISGVDLDKHVADDILAQAYMSVYDTYSAEELLQRRDAFVFGPPYDNTDRHIGFYFRDIDIAKDPSLATKIKASAPHLFASRPQTNILDGIPEDEYKVWSGARSNHAWMYGGQSAAGWHSEDSFMYFINYAPLIEFTGIKDVEKLVMDYMNKYSMRRWHFYKGSEVVLSTLFHSKFPTILSPFGIDNLICRGVLINPAILLNDTGFITVYQRPGQRVLSLMPHSVTGYSVMHLAWNFANSDMYPVHGEFQLGNKRRTQIFSNPPDFDQYMHDSHSFILTCELIDYYLRNYEHCGEQMPPGLVRAATDTLRSARKVSRTDTSLIVTLGSIDDDNTFSLPSSRQCSICTAPCPISIYQFQHSSTTTLNCCNPCASQYMLLPHNTMPIAKYITFVSDRQLQDAL